MTRTLLLLVLFVALGCGASDRARTGDEPDRKALPQATAGSGSAPAPGSADRASRPRIVILGDSLTAGLGLPVDKAYPALLQAQIDREGLPYEVVNAGVSGDTSAGGLRRLDWALDGDVRVLIIELGANDGLRGLPVAQLKANLRAIIGRAKERGIRVILVGMEAPPNFGAVYTAEFRRAYRDLAREEGVELLPFLLAGVAGVPSLNQPDGIHPNEAGARIVERNIWTVLQKVVVTSARP